MSGDWRPLTEVEIATWPKARLGGALAGVAIVTGVLTAILLLLLIVFMWTIGARGFEGVFRSLGDNRYFMIGLVSASSVLALMVWSAITFVLILSRARAAQAVIAVGFGLLCVFGIVTSATTQWLIMSQSGGSLAEFATALLPIVPQWLGGVTLTIGLIGYFVGGVRPNAYFRRRVAVPGGDAT